MLALPCLRQTPWAVDQACPLGAAKARLPLRGRSGRPTLRELLVPAATVMPYSCQMRCSGATLAGRTPRDLQLACLALAKESPLVILNVLAYGCFVPGDTRERAVPSAAPRLPSQPLVPVGARCRLRWSHVPLSHGAHTVTCRAAPPPQRCAEAASRTGSPPSSDPGPVTPRRPGSGWQRSGNALPPRTCLREAVARLKLHMAVLMSLPAALALTAIRILVLP